MRVMLSLLRSLPPSFVFSALLLLAGAIPQSMPAQIMTDADGDVCIGILPGHPLLPHPSAALEVASVSKGFLLARMTTEQRDRIVRPAVGLQIYNITDNRIQFNCGTEERPVWCLFVYEGPNGGISAQLSPGALWYGGPDSAAAELAAGAAGAILSSNGSGPVWVANPGGLLPAGSAPYTTLVWNGTEWVENTMVTMNPTDGNIATGGSVSAASVTTTGNATVGGNALVNGDLTVNGNLDLPLTEDHIWVGNPANRAAEVSPGSDGSLLRIDGTTPTWTPNPGGLLPAGTVNGATLRWDGTEWVENTNLTSDGAGNSVINGPTVSVPNIPNVVTGTDVVITDGAGNLQTINVNDLLGNATLTQNNIWVGDASNNPAELAPGATDQVLQIDGSGSPTWGTINLLPTGTATNTTLVWDNVAGEWVENTEVTLDPTNGNTAINGDLTVDGDATLNGATVSVPNIPATTTSTTVVVTDGSGNLQTIDINDLVNNATLTQNNIWVGDASNNPAELAPGTTDQVLQIDGSGAPTWGTINLLPTGTAQNATLVWDNVAGEWVENTEVTLDPTNGNTAINGDLTVDGPTVSVPNIPNVVTGTDVVITDGAGNLQTIDIDDLVDNATLTQNNIWVGDASNNPAELAPGTTDQVLQIDGSGAPTWGTINLLPTGTAQNTTLVWDNVAGEWVENTEVTLDPTNGNTAINGDLNVDGTTVSVPNIPNVVTGTDVVITDGTGNLQTIDINDLVDNATLTQNSIWVGDASNNPAELGTTNVPGAVLAQDGSGAPVWVNPSSSSFWSTSGNIGTSAATNFIGTADAQDLVFRTNNTARVTVGQGATDGVVTIAGTADAVVGNTAADPVWDVRLAGDMYAAGIFKSGGSLWMDGRNAARNQVTSDNTLWLTTRGANALEIGVDELGDPAQGRGRVMRYEPNNRSANIIGGFNGNAATSGVVGATVGGGGSNGSANLITDDFGTIGGGEGNRAGDNGGTTSDARYASVGGGLSNTASGENSTAGGGYLNAASGANATIGGGRQNVAGDINTTIGGGAQNRATNNNAVVAGGSGNIAGGNSSAIGGGANNSAASTNATVAGGSGNSALHMNSTVGGGLSNTASAQGATVVGGEGNTAAGNGSFVGGGVGNRAASQWSVVVGGDRDTVNGDYGVIGGGRLNRIGANGNMSFIGNGSNNVIDAGPGFIGTGGGNVIDGGSGAIVSGGSNHIGGQNAFIGGGQLNEVSLSMSSVVGGRLNRATSDFTFIGGGDNNVASGLGSAVVGGGVNGVFSVAGNTASGLSSTVAGGYGNTASGSTSFVGGGISNAAAGTGSFVGGGQGSVANNDNTVAVGGRTNTASGIESFVGGGFNNRASGQLSLVVGGQSNTASALQGVVGGGVSNTASGEASAILGGALNTASAYLSTVVGGNLNTAAGVNSAVSGGSANSALANYSFVGSGLNNVAASTAIWSAVLSGSHDTVTGANSVIGGGRHNDITHDFALIGSGEANRVAAAYGVIAGGNNNIVGGTHGVIGGGTNNRVGGLVAAVVGGAGNVNNGVNSFIGAGSGNMIGNVAGGAVIGGGDSNYIEPSQPYNTIGGGNKNRITSYIGTIGGGSGNTVSAAEATVSGGSVNTASGGGAVVGGGNNNAASNVNATVSGGAVNTASGNVSVVGGGRFNTATALAATVAGGSFNTASGEYSFVGGGGVDFMDPNNNIASGQYSIIVGGRFNRSSSTHSFIGGGYQNIASAQYALVGGGNLNTASGQYSFVGGGAGNIASGTSGVVVGGDQNTAAGSAFVGSGFQNLALGGHSVVVGGFQNRDSAEQSAIVSGFTNRVMQSGSRSFIGSGLGNVTAGVESAIVGGATNTIVDTAQYGFIGGGTNNLVRGTAGTVAGGSGNGAQGDFSFAGGGSANNASGFGAVIVGGGPNAAGGNFSAIGGGQNNLASSDYVVIGGGQGNDITVNSRNSVIAGGNVNRIAGPYSVISGGDSNTIMAGSAHSSIQGGKHNQINGSFSTIAGGEGVTTGSRTFAFHANNASGTLPIAYPNSEIAAFSNVNLWLANNNNTASQIRFYEPNATVGPFPDVLGTTKEFSSFQAQAQTQEIEYLLPAAVPGALPANDRVLTITGITPTAGGAQVTLSWTDNTTLVSSRERKENFLALSGESVLGKFRDLPLGTWNYKGEGVRHYGVMAQDFFGAFGNDGVGVVGADTTVNVIDLHGVAYMAIQGLEARTRESGERIEALERENADLRARLARLEAKLTEE